MISSVATTRCNNFCLKFSSKCVRVVASFVGIYGAKFLKFLQPQKLHGVFHSLQKCIKGPYVSGPMNLLEGPMNHA